MIFLKAMKNAPVREAPTSLRSSVVVLLCRPGLTIAETLAWMANSNENDGVLKQWTPSGST